MSQQFFVPHSGYSVFSGDTWGHFLQFGRTYPMGTGSRMPYSVRNLAPLRMLAANAARP